MPVCLQDHAGAKPPSAHALGIVQCVYWGVLYYAFAVLLLPLAEDLAAGTTAVVGAFSLGLAVAALAAAAVGRAIDRGRGVALMRAGSLATPILLLVWASLDSLPALYAVWAGLGACMALTLYEPAFALLTRSIVDAGQRLRALATVTLAGGLASTVFVPLVGGSAATLGWRDTLWLLAAAWLLAALVLERGVLRRIPAAPHAAPPRAQRAHGNTPAAATLPLATPFLASTFASMLVVTLTIPMLADAGERLDRAALALAAFGLMQLPGRLWLARATRQPSPGALLRAPLLLQAAGLLLLAGAAWTPSPLTAAFAGVALAGAGAGIHTVARPWLVAQRHGADVAGALNGRIAAWQGYARAAGPVAAAALMTAFGAREAMLVGVLVLLAAMLPARRVHRDWRDATAQPALRPPVRA